VPVTDGDQACARLAEERNTLRTELKGVRGRGLPARADGQQPARLPQGCGSRFRASRRSTRIIVFSVSGAARSTGFRRRSPGTAAPAAQACTAGRWRSSDGSKPAPRCRQGRPNAGGRLEFRLNQLRNRLTAPFRRCARGNRALPAILGARNTAARRLRPPKPSNSRNFRGRNVSRAGRRAWNRPGFRPGPPSVLRFFT